MKFTLSWLRRHLETEAALDEIVDRLTAIGLEVEEVVDRGQSLAPFTVGEVIEAGPHPDADRLTVCLVDVGDKRIQVVCGAPNVRTGMKGVFAAAGLTVPGTEMKLKRTVIRGFESHGMLCSERELGLGDDHDGIIELPDEAPVGAPFATVLGLDDPLIDVAVTPDRSDCLGVRGIARDLAAAGIGRLLPLEVAAMPGGYESPLKVHLEFDQKSADACPYFIGRYLRGVRNGPSPSWLRERLVAVGLRPISALVDITNWLTLDLGRPAHVFDADRVSGDLRVRLARAGECFEALDERIYEADETMTAIHDDRGLQSLAGVIGGSQTGCTKSTTNVFLEIATFDPKRTAATGRALGIESEARYRFERGVDPAFLDAATEVATRLIVELCGGEPSDLTRAGKEPAWERRISFRPSRVETLGGVTLAADRCREVLERLGCRIDGDGESLTVAVPSWRPDIDVEADLVEEVLRITGYDRITAVSLPRPSAVAKPVLSLAQRRVSWTKRALAGRGLVEAVTWSFVSQRQAELFGGGGETLRLANPINADLAVMRPSLLPSLIAAAGRNAAHGFANLALFETGQIYQDDTCEGQGSAAGGVRCGKHAPNHWLVAERPVDAFDARADATAVLAACGVAVQGLRISEDAPAWYHPGRSATLALGPKVLAHFGEIHPRVLAALGGRRPVVGFEVFLTAQPEPRAKRGRTRAALNISPFQAVLRDFAFIVDIGVRGADLMRAARSADKSLIDEVTVFDVYEGSGVDDGKKSIAISVRLQPSGHTLTDSEIDAVSARIVVAVEKATGGILRAA